MQAEQRRKRRDEALAAEEARGDGVIHTREEAAREADAETKTATSTSDNKEAKPNPYKAPKQSRTLTRRRVDPKDGAHSGA